MNVAKSIQSLMPTLAQQPQGNQDIIVSPSIYCLLIIRLIFVVSVLQDQFKQTLQQLSNDADPDVHYYATQALKAGQ